MYVFLNTLPKSGSGYIYEHMTDALGLPDIRISKNGFPYDEILPNRLAPLKEGAFTQEHMDASEPNLDALKAANITKIFIHLRDPRQAALSWHYHIASVMTRGPALEEWVRRNPPEGYGDFSEMERLEWVVTGHYPLMVRWICEWIDVADNNRDFDLQFGDYRELIEAPAKYMNRILEFFDVDGLRMAADQILPPRKGVSNFRKGDPHEYKQIFSDRQLRLMDLMLPERIAVRFGWQ